MENGILIKDMAVYWLKKQTETFILGNSRIIKRKAMEHGRTVLTATNILGHTKMIKNTGMEYTGGMMKQYITESGKRERKKGMDIKGGQTAINIGESTRMT